MSEKEKQHQVILVGKSNLPLANGYNSYNRYRSNKTKKSIDPMLEDIEVEYIRSFDEVLNSPNYWADIAAYGL